MRKRTLTITALALLALKAIAQPINGHIRLLWDDLLNQGTNVTYNVHWSTNVTVPLTNWVTLTNVPTTSVDLDVVPGNYFFYVTATNFWGESSPSNLASTPGVAAGGGNFRIVKLP